MIEVTETAEQHFVKLINDNMPGSSIRIEVQNPGTAKARVDVTFCSPDDSVDNDEKIKLKGFELYIEKQSFSVLNDAKIDYKIDKTGGQLEIYAPRLHGKPLDKSLPISEQVEHLIISEFNPDLSNHGGNVSLSHIDGDTIYLKFGGGCHGCSMSSITLRDSIEKTIKEKLGDHYKIVDATDHSLGENPYF